MANLIAKIDSLRSVDLQQVLKAFKLTNYGRKKDLRDRVVKLLGDPEDPDPAVRDKIEEVASRCSFSGWRGRRTPSVEPPMSTHSFVEIAPVPRGRSQRSAAIVARNQLAATAALSYDIPHARRVEEDYSPSPSPDSSPPRPSRNFGHASSAMEPDKTRMNGTRPTPPPAPRTVVRVPQIDSTSVTITASSNSNGARAVCMVSAASNSSQQSVPNYSSSSSSTMNPMYPPAMNSWQNAFLSSVGSGNAIENFNKNAVTITPVVSQTNYVQPRSGMTITSTTIMNNWSAGSQSSASITSATVQISKNTGRSPSQSRPIVPVPASSYTQVYPTARARPPYGDTSSAPHVPISPDVKMEELPFYPVLDCLLKPITLVSTTPSTLPDKCAKFTFTLTPQQSQSITQSLVRTPGGFAKPGIQIQLRFSKLETSCPQKDFFPPNIAVSVNNSPVELPKLIHSTQAGIPPKRPCAPLDITAHRTYSHAKPNQVTVTWQIDPCNPDVIHQQYVASVWLVKQLSASDLVKQLKTKGPKDADYTRAMIKEKLRNDEDEVAMTFLRVSLTCPLGKCRMQMPCRSTVSCAHLQCFDANFFVCMNEKRPSWLCPVCDKEIPFRTLVLDGYFMDVLEANPPEDMIELHLDGSWSLPGKRNEPVKPAQDQLSIDVPSPGSVNSDGICVLDVKEVKPEKSRALVVQEVNLCSSDEENEPTNSSTSTSDDEPPAVNGSASRARRPGQRAVSSQFVNGRSSVLDLTLSRKRPSAEDSGEDSDSSVELTLSRSPRKGKKARRVRSSSEESWVKTPIKKDDGEGESSVPERPVPALRPRALEVIEIDLSSDDD